MDPHLLRTFVTVARLASFSEAARDLGYTQSAVSQHIAALEQDLGAPLLTRRPVAAGTADLGLVDGLAAPSDPLRLPDVAPLTTYAVAEEPVCVLLPAAHPLAGRAGLRLGDLADARWLDSPDTALSLDRLRAANGGRGFRPALRYDGTDVRVLTGLAAAGHGLAVLPRTAATGVAGAVAVPLTEPRIVHRIELVYAGTPTGAAAALVAALSVRS